MTFDFLKVHNAGNDFPLFDAIAHPEVFGRIDGPLAAALCHRQFGIGGDGVLILSLDGGTPRMEIWNSDGSRAKMCGNGLSCVARHIVETGVRPAGTFDVLTDAGVRTPTVVARTGGPAGEAPYSVTIDMGEPAFGRASIPMRGAPADGRVVNEPVRVLDRTFQVTAVSMGNPHAVIHVEGPVDLHRYGPALERHELFPDRTNVEFVTVLSEQEVRIDVWERGAGPTLACGTGTAAVAAAGVLTGRTARRILAHLPGGDLTAEYADSGRVFITCAPQVAYAGRVDLAKHQPKR